MEPQNELDPIVEALFKLPASDQKLVANLIRGMAERAGIPVSQVSRAELKPPIEYLGMWLTKVTAERFSERTIRAYEWAITRILANDPVPTTQSVRGYIARRLASGISANHVGLERKALRAPDGALGRKVFEMLQHSLAAGAGFGLAGDIDT